ncbi:uncharacterized protein LOC136070490 [Quercus suber]|uniref:uncharacterized protein LOC136070490 n=1 Tax=Quercus suber TaxID=58331 RepID=UPI0032DEE164
MAIYTDKTSWECVIKAHDPRLHYINVAVEGFLLPEGAPIPEGTLLTQPITDGTSTSQPIPEGVPNVTSPLQYTLSEATSSHPSSQKGDEEEARPREVMDVSDLEDLYKVFNQLPSPVTKEEITSSDLMGIQRKPKSNLLELLESPTRGKPYGKSIPPPLPSPPSQPRIPTPPPVQQTCVEPVDHKERGMTRATQVVFKAKGMVNSSHRKMKVAVDAFQVADKSLKDLKVQLAEEQKERKYVVASLESAEKQTESQRLLHRSTKNQLATSKKQIVALKKKLEEVEKAKATAEKAKDKAEKARDAAEQHGYEVGVAETEDTLRAEVPQVCRTYDALTWDEALNQAGVEASSMLRRVESIYYTPAIRPRSSANSQADLVSSEAGEIPSSLPPAPPIDKNPSEGSGQVEGTVQTGEADKKAIQGSDLPPATPKETSKNQEASQTMEVVLATLTIPPKKGPEEKDEASTTAANVQLPKDSKDKIVIKMKK